MKIEKTYSSVGVASEKLLNMILGLNDIMLAEKELQLFTLLTLAGPTERKELCDRFCENYNTTDNTFKNTMTKLRDKELVLKENGKFKSVLGIAKPGNKLSIEIKITEDV